MVKFYISLPFPLNKQKTRKSFPVFATHNTKIRLAPNTTGFDLFPPSIQLIPQQLQASIELDVLLNLYQKQKVKVEPFLDTE